MIHWALIEPEWWALAAVLVCALGLLARRRAQHAHRRPAAWQLVFLVSYPVLLWFDEYRVRVIVRGSGGAFDAVRTASLAWTAVAAVCLGATLWRGLRFVGWWRLAGRLAWSAGVAVAAAMWAIR